MTHLKNVKQLIFVLIVSTISIFPVHPGNKAAMVSNNLEKFNAVQGKLKLTLVRVWGESEEDEYIQAPYQVLTSNTGDVYFCDMSNHVIKVFDRNGKFLRAIGRKGRGPGDFNLPSSMAISPTGDLWVAEIGGMRVQQFSPQGKSKHIFKFKSHLDLIGITNDGNLIVNSHMETLKTGRLFFIMDKNGKILRNIGTFHDPVKSFITSERLLFAADEQENLFVSGRWAGVIRKYTTNGDLQQCITFETPLEGYYNVHLNENGSEIVRLNSGSSESESTAKDKLTKRGVLISSGERKEMPPDFVSCIDVDSGKIFVTVPTRKKTRAEEKATETAWSASSGPVHIARDYSVLEKMDLYTLLVFNRKGKLFAASKLKTPDAQFHVSGDQLFIVDGFSRQVTQYKIEFAK